MIYKCRCGHDAKTHELARWPYTKLECQNPHCSCTKLRLAPQPGHVTEVELMPVCNFCGDPALFDGKTKAGPWAFMCDYHREQHAAYEDTGTGKMQILVAAE